MPERLSAEYLAGEKVRAVEHASIRSFLERRSSLLGGRVLDYGCGRQPYRDVVEAAGGTYEPYDRAHLPANVSGKDVGAPVALGEWRDAVICTQVVQYWPDPSYELRRILHLVRPGGALLLTYPTCWPEVEPEDLWRFTRAGMDRLLTDAAFEVVEHELRASIAFPGFELPVGYGAVARPRP